MAAEEPPTAPSVEPSVEADHHGGSGSGAGEERLVMYKTKLVQFLGRSTSIILQNDNGPCPLLAICNVLLLRNVIELSPDVPEVSQDQLLALVADRLVESNSEMKSKDEEYVSNQQQNISDAIDLLPRLATGIDVNVHFRKINDFEFTRECAIFDLLDIGLYHGWLVDPEDKATTGAIGSKSYNTLVGELVALEAQISEDRGIPPEEDTVDFAAATAATLGIPSPCLSRGRSFDDPLPVVPTEKVGRKGDLEEEEELLKALKLSRAEVSTESIPIDKSLLPESTSSNSSSDLEDGAIIETSDSRINSETIVSERIDTCGTIHSPCLPLSKDENLSESSNTGAASFGIILENNTQSVKSGSVGHPDQSIPVQSEEIQGYTAPLSDVLASQESIPVAAVSDSSTVSCADKSQMNIPKDASLETKAFDEKSIGQSVDQINGDSLSPGICQSNVDTGRDSPKADESVCSDLENGEPIYEGEECILDSGHSTYQSQEPVYEGEVVLANQVDKMAANTTSIQSDKEPSGRKNSGLTTISLEEGKLIHYFLENNASQLTIYGLFRLQEGLNERELCVFFRNNHFSTMFKFGGELYLLATDQGYINQPDLVWEKLNEVNGDTIFMTGNFTEFKMDNQNDSWSQQNAMTDTTEYLAALKGSTTEGSSLSSDLQLAIALQEQEFGRQPVCPEPQNPQPAPLTRPRLVTGPQVPRRQPPPKQEPKSKEKCAVM